jgi:hypothetical protein
MLVQHAPDEMVAVRLTVGLKQKWKEGGRSILAFVVA